MAVRYETIYVDDLDGVEIEDGRAETIKFGVDGKDYEIDLSEQNAAAFREAVQPYLSAARPAEAGSQDLPPLELLDHQGRDGEDPRVGPRERLHRVGPRPDSRRHPRGIQRGELACRGQR